MHMHRRYLWNFIPFSDGTILMEESTTFANWMGGRAIDHDSREHATYRVCTPFHAFVLARSNDHHRCELMNSWNVRLPRDLFIYPALNGRPIIPAETMAPPFHGCTILCIRRYVIRCNIRGHPVICIIL